MKSKQRGFAISTMATLIVIAVTLAGVLYGGYSYGTYKQEVKTKEVEKTLEKRDGELKEANEKIRTLNEANKRLEADLKLLNDIIESNKKVALEREAEIKKLNGRIGELERKLPKPKPRDPSKPVDQEAEKASMARYDVIYEVYLTVSEDPVPAQEPADSHKDVEEKEVNATDPPYITGLLTIDKHLEVLT